MSEDEQSLDEQKDSPAIPTKSFSINSILSKQSTDTNKDEEKERSDEDVPAVVSKLELPVFSGLGKIPGLFSRSGEGAGLSLGHLPAWYHWYASQQCLQQLQQKKREYMYMFTDFFHSKF